MLKGLEIKSNTAIKSKDNKGTIHLFIDPYTLAQNEKLWWAMRKLNSRPLVPETSPIVYI
jgi:hypothetical protein